MNLDFLAENFKQQQHAQGEGRAEMKWARESGSKAEKSACKG